MWLLAPKIFLTPLARLLLVEMVQALTPGRVQLLDGLPPPSL